MKAIALAVLALTLAGCPSIQLERDFTSANLSDWRHSKDRAFGYVNAAGMYVPGFLSTASESTKQAHAEFLDAAIERARAADELAAKGAGK